MDISVIANQVGKNYGEIKKYVVRNIRENSSSGSVVNFRKGQSVRILLLKIYFPLTDFIFLNRGNLFLLLYYP